MGPIRGNTRAASGFVLRPIRLAGARHKSGAVRGQEAPCRWLEAPAWFVCVCRLCSCASRAGALAVSDDGTRTIKQRQAAGRAIHWPRRPIVSLRAPRRAPAGRRTQTHTRGSPRPAGSNVHQTDEKTRRGRATKASARPLAERGLNLSRIPRAPLFLSLVHLAQSFRSSAPLPDIESRQAAAI